MNDALLPNKNTNLETAILRFHENFVSMKPIESFSGIFTNCNHKSLSFRSNNSSMSHDSPISSSRRTDAPPGWRFTNFETSYTLASMMIHYGSNLS